MTTEDFRDFFDLPFGMLFYEMRCSKSCYLYDLEVVALFDIVEQGVFSMNSFLIDKAVDFYFHAPVACSFFSSQ